MRRVADKTGLFSANQLFVSNNYKVASIRYLSLYSLPKQNYANENISDQTQRRDDEISDYRNDVTFQSFKEIKIDFVTHDPASNDVASQLDTNGTEIPHDIWTCQWAYNPSNRRKKFPLFSNHALKTSRGLSIRTVHYTRYMIATYRHSKQHE